MSDTANEFTALAAKFGIHFLFRPVNQGRSLRPGFACGRANVKSAVTTNNCELIRWQGNWQFPEARTLWIEPFGYLCTAAIF